MSARTRLFLLIAVMVALAVVRFARGPGPADAAPVATVIVRDRHAMRSASVEPAAMRTSIAERVSDDDDEDVGAPANPFAVRPTPSVQQVSLSLVPQPPVIPPKQSPAVVTPPIFPPPVPEPPFRVIGTYEDSGGRGVFVATPAGTILARDGSPMDDDHRVETIAANQVVVQRMSTQSRLHLPIPVSVAR